MIFKKKLQQNLFLLILFLSFNVNAQVTCETGTAAIPRSGTTILNGVTITSSYTGDVTNFTNSVTTCSGNVTTSNNSLYVGRGNPATPLVASPWSITLNFDRPVNDLVFVIVGTGAGNLPNNENFIFNSDGGSVSISAGANCFSTISGNLILSGANAPGSPSNGGGGIFKITAPSNYTQLVISGNGGLAGSVIGLCSSSVINSCAPSAANPDSDGDGIADACDLDDDNDGILDTVEGFCESQSVYTMNIAASVANANISFGINGGTFNIVYTLTSGSAVPGLGNSFNVPFTYSDLNNSATGVNHVWQVAYDFFGSIAIVPDSNSLYAGLPPNNTNTSEDVSGSSNTFSDGRFRYLLQTSRIDQLGSFTTTFGNLPVLSTSLSSYSSQTNLRLWSTHNLEYNASLPTQWFSGYYARPLDQNTLSTQDPNIAPLTTNYGATHNWIYTAFDAPGGTNAMSQGTRGLIQILRNTITYCNHRDTDGDGIPDYLDLDSDNDGCPDAIEGGASFTSTNLVNSSMSGGNVGATSGSYNQPITQNLGNTVNTTSTSANYGVPTIAGSGQAIGTSQTANPVLAAGTASANQTIATGSTATALSLTGATGSIQWQISTDNVTFTNISGATNTTYAPGTLIATRYYKALVTSLGGCTTLSNTVTINVVPPFDCTDKIYSLSSVTGEIRAFNNSNTSGALGTVINTTPHPTALSGAPNGPNALGYSPATGKFYYVLNQNNGSGNTFVSYDPNTNIYQTLASTSGYIYRGTVTNDGLGYYALTSSNELKYYNISNNTWTSITNYFVDQNGNDLITILNTYSGGDLAIDGNGDLWILAGTNFSPTTILFRAKGPLPKTDLGAVPMVLEQITQQNIGNGPSGIAFNSAGELLITNSSNLYKMNNDFSISLIGNLSPTNGAGDLASCAFPANPLSYVCYKDPVNNGTGTETKMGITLLKRAGTDNQDNWPLSRKSGHIALESNKQGFVITRIAKANLGNITTPQEGMMVYDTTDKCLKIYSDGTWACFSKATCQ